MNNSFARLVDGMCATLRAEVLTRLDDEFARGQVYGVINLLNTFKVRADWSAGFLVQQIGAQRAAIDAVALLVDELPQSQTMPVLPHGPAPQAMPIAELLKLRDEGNHVIAALLRWLTDAGGELEARTAADIEQLLRAAMRAEVEIELKNAPRPLFAEMSSGTEA